MRIVPSDVTWSLAEYSLMPVVVSVDMHAVSSAGLPHPTDIDSASEESFDIHETATLLKRQKDLESHDRSHDPAQNKAESHDPKETRQLDKVLTNGCARADPSDSGIESITNGECRVDAGQDEEHSLLL